MARPFPPPPLGTPSLPSRSSRWPACRRAPPPSTSAATRSSTSSSTGRCSRRSTSTSTSTPRKRPPSARPPAWRSAGTTGSPRSFGREFPERKSIILYADQTDFQQTTVTRGLIGEGTGGVTEGLRTRVVLPFTGNFEDTDHVLGHELVHVFQYDILQERRAPRAGDGALLRASEPPALVHRGLAEYLSLGRDSPQTAMWLRDALARDELPDLSRLSRDPRYFPYRWGHAFWAYVGGRWGDTVVGRLFARGARVGLEAALQRSWDGREAVLRGLEDGHPRGLWAGAREPPDARGPGPAPAAPGEGEDDRHLHLAGAQPGRHPGRLPLDPQPVHLRPLSGGRADGGDHGQAVLRGLRRALRLAALPRLGRRLVAGRLEVRLRRAEPGGQRARHHRRALAPDRAAQRGARGGAALEPDLVAGRPVHRLLRLGRGDRRTSTWSTSRAAGRAG